MKVFLSHSTRDTEIAAALKKLLVDVFGDRVEVSFSTDQEPGGGIEAGKKWRDWINKEIAEADQTHVLLTTNSLSRPWILWESGVAAGVSLGRPDAGSVVPVAFGLSADDIPSPLQSDQAVLGDTAGANGVRRLLQRVNAELAPPLGAAQLDARANQHLPGYLAGVAAELESKTPVEALLAKMPAAFSAKNLQGHWVTSYEFVSGGKTMFHGDIATVVPESDRWVAANNSVPPPRTERHAKPFRNNIDAQLVGRHLIGHWKNIDDTSYFGAIHLAVLPGDDMMDGYYTALTHDAEAGSLPWRWVRIDAATMAGRDLPALRLKDPQHINELLKNHDRHAGRIKLNDIVEDDPNAEEDVNDPVEDD